MSELKPCPFCGADNGYVDVIPNPFSNDIYSRGHCIKCHAVGTFYVQSYLEGELRPSFEQMAQMATEQWNTRPIEDALQARIAELEAAQRWRVVADGELPEVYRDEDGEFIPFLVCENDKGFPYRALYDGLNWGNGMFVADVTHWMPLPELPKEREEWMKKGTGKEREE